MYFFPNVTEPLSQLACTSCPVPCDHIPVRSWPMFRARQLMRDHIESLQGILVLKCLALLPVGCTGVRSWLNSPAKSPMQWKCQMLLSLGLDSGRSHSGWRPISGRVQFERHRLQPNSCSVLGRSADVATLSAPPMMILSRMSF